MMLYFRKPRKASGYALQMIIDDQKKVARVGYCLTITHCYELKAKDFEDLRKELKTGGYTIVNG